MNIRKIVVRALSGIAVGAILGVLFTTYKVSEKRRKITKKSSDTLYEVKNKITLLMDGLAERIEDEKEDITGAYDRVKTQIEGLNKIENVL